MIRVLHIFHHLNNAGTERVILNYYKNIERKKVQFDFLVYDNGNIEEEFKKLGANIYKIKGDSKKELYNEILFFLKENKYNIVHIHMCDMIYYATKAAHKAKVSRIIVHSHNGMKNLSLSTRLKRMFLELKYLNGKATDYFACSKMAAQYMFPLNYKKTRIIYNAININDFKFNEKIRENKRKELKIKEEEKVVITVGRLEEQKNHIKMLNVAKNNKNENIKFLIVGEGSLKQEIEKYIDENNLNEKVFLLGNRNDVNELLYASDLFILTSKFEGLGIVLIESQISGLQTLSSNQVPPEADLKLGNFHILDLDLNDLDWSKKIDELLLNRQNRKDYYKKAQISNYNIEEQAKIIQNIYLEKQNKC